MKILSLTWNTHGFTALPFTLQEDADIVTISLQECPLLPDTGLLFPSMKHRFFTSSGPLQTIILSKQPVKIATMKIGMGIGSYVNKGFIACMLNNAIVHINVHLAAHEDKNDVRMEQIAKILKYINYTDYAYKLVIFTGDFNFRVYKNEEQGAYFLKKYRSFQESKIGFEHTFKYKGHVLGNKRTPSYCDRIFLNKRYPVKFFYYKSFHDIVESDHKPVCLYFSVDKLHMRYSHGMRNIRSITIREKLTSFYHRIYRNRIPITAISLCATGYLSFKIIFPALLALFYWLFYRK
ncbi:hypothetical protein ENBRE01_0196 [Enteropsectra breve]|nr:hypothetical protein ENBRE01_0196 [Enteropsectra breve]